MAWPSVSDYQEAMQTPQVNFGDADLESGSPVLTPLGLPRPISGGNASVYQIRSGKLEFAVRCFLRNIPGIRQRYETIDKHLRASKLQAKVGFDYLQDGVRIRGEWYPILKMEWVRGASLSEHIESQLSDGPRLRVLADDWVVLMKQLVAAKIAHGDLQHGNVLVANDKLVLIDYDGMCVPALEGDPSAELGHPSYQHPRRASEDFGLGMDRFSALVIHTAILALSHDARLWTRFDNGDNLLFTRDDFESPEHSELFAELEKSGDEQVVNQARVLRAACTEAHSFTPELADAARLGRALAPTVSKGPKPEPAAPPPRAGGENAALRRKNHARQRGQQRLALQQAQVQAAAPSGNTPSWLASLMTTPAQGGGTARPSGANSAPTAGSGGPSPNSGAFSLGQSWKRNVRATGAGGTPSSAPGSSGFGRRAALFVLSQLVAYAIDPLLLLLSLSVWFGIHLANVSRRQPGGSTGTVTPGTASCTAANAPTTLTFSLDSRLLAVGGDRRAGVFEAGSGKPVGTLAPQNSPIVGIVAAGKDRFLAACGDGTVRVFDSGGDMARTWRLARIFCAAASDDGQLVAFGTGGRLIKVCAADGSAQGSLRGHNSEVHALAFTRDRQHLVSGSADHTVRVWSIANRSCEHVLLGHNQSVEAVAVSGDGRLVAAGATDGRVCIWDAPRGKLLQQVDTAAGGVHALAFSPDAASLFAGGAGKSIHCIDPATGGIAGKVAGHTAAVTGLAVSGDGSRIASVDSHGTVVAWTHRRKSAGITSVTRASKAAAGSANSP